MLLKISLSLIDVPERVVFNLDCTHVLIKCTLHLNLLYETREARFILSNPRLIARECRLMEMCPEVQSSPACHPCQPQNRSILIDSSGSGGLIERSSRVTGGPHTQRVLPEYSSGLKTLNTCGPQDDAEARMHLQPQFIVLPGDAATQRG